MGKFCAAVITGVVIAWLGPMCAHLPANTPVAAAPVRAPLSKPAPAPEPAPVVSSAAPVVPTGPSAPAAVPAPEPAAAPARPAGEQILFLSTYRLKKPFPTSDTQKGKLMIPLFRENRAAKAVVETRLILIARHEGVELDRAEGSLPPNLAPGSTGYHSLNLNESAVETILNSPADTGDELDWALTYKFEGSGTRKCFRLRALPRRAKGGGIDWLIVDSSRACPAP